MVQNILYIIFQFKNALNSQKNIFIEKIKHDIQLWLFFYLIFIICCKFEFTNK